MTSPAWSRRCTCGRVAATFYCDHCQAFAMDYPGDENLVDAWKVERQAPARVVDPDSEGSHTGDDCEVCFGRVVVVQPEDTVIVEPRPKSELQKQVEHLAASGARTKTVTRTGKADH